MSRINFGAKPNMYPLPVLIIATYDKDGNPDAMNAAWGVVTDFNEISISMGDHKTTDNLAATGAFTVSMATEDTVVGCDYVGIESGRKVPDKFARRFPCNEERIRQRAADRRASDGTGVQSEKL